MQLGLRRAGRNVEQRRDLVVLVAFDVVKHEYFARPVGQGRQGRLEVHGEVTRRHRRRNRVENLVPLAEPSPPSRLGAEPLNDDVDGETMEPGGEGSIAAERAEFLPDANE